MTDDELENKCGGYQDALKLQGAHLRATIERQKADIATLSGEKCALAADSLNARAALRMLMAVIQQPQRCSPDFPKYAAKRANEVLDAALMDTHEYVVAMKADIATLREHLDRQSAHLHTAWAERDKARAALQGLLPFVVGPEDEDSPGYADVLAEAQKAAEGGA